MRILVYSFDFHPCPGGVDTFVRSLLLGLRQRGHTVDFLCSTHIQFLTRAVRADITRFQEQAQHDARYSSAMIRNLEALKYAHEQLLSQIDVASYDVVHSNNGISSRVVRTLHPNVPLLGTIHGSFLHETQGNGRHPSAEESAFLRQCDQYAVECPTLVHTVSTALLDGLPSFSPDRHLVIHNGVEVNDFHPNLVDHVPVRIAAAGLLSYRKGYDVLLRALQEIQKNGVDGFDVTLFGDGPEKKRLMEQAETLGLPIVFRGMVPHSELCAQLPQYDIFVHPSRYESFGLAVTEAMAAGCAIICTHEGGLREQVDHEVNGLLFERDDAAGLAACILRLVQEDALRERLRRAAVRRVRAEFAMDKVLDQFERAYAEVVKRSAANKESST